jgi:hypothetical protein
MWVRPYYYICARSPRFLKNRYASAPQLPALVGAGQLLPARPPRSQNLPKIGLDSARLNADLR